MSISAAPAYTSTHIANDFAGFAAGSPVAMKPIKGFESKSPAQIQRQKFEVVGVQGQIDRAIGQVFDTHRRAVKTHGLAGVERGKSANILNPAKDGMLMTTAAIMPVFAPVASALAIASVLNYVNADRKGLGKAKLQAQFEDEFRSANTRSSIFDVPWSQTGYHAVKPANDEPELSLEEFEFLSRPIEQDHSVQILLGQRAQLDGVEASNENRALKGIALSESSVEMAADMDSKRLTDENRFDLNLPGNYL